MNEGKKKPFISKKHEHENTDEKGHLKIFLGIAAGVGKTFAMLKEAQYLQNDHVDVAIGFIDTHGRKETLLLLKGLTNIPPKKVLYKERYFDELDLEAIRLRRPHIVLIDEMAHTMIPGSPHEKRWEAILDLLNDGINVYTTLNIQHIESLRDLIEAVAEIPVRETVPDFIFELSTSIQFIDISPEELLDRLNNGKIYLGMQSKIAARNFFQKERLKTLREIALRFVAEIIEKDLRGTHAHGRFFQEWEPKEKIHPSSQKQILHQFTPTTIDLSYLTITLLTTLLIAINWLLLPFIGYDLSWLIFIAGLFGFSFYFTKGPLILSAILCLFFWGFLFIPFINPLPLENSEKLSLYALYLITAGIGGILIQRNLQQQRQLKWNEESSQVLYEIVERIVKGASQNETLGAIERSLETILNGNCEVIVRDENNEADLSRSKLICDDKEKHAVTWALENCKEAGYSSGSLPTNKNFYIPIHGFHHCLGVIAYCPQANSTILCEEKRLLYAVSQHLSLYFARQLEFQND